MGFLPHSYNRYATGNKTYEGGRPVATTGTVDPTGYVDRGRRSQLAASILNRKPGMAHPPESFVGETVARTPVHILAGILLANRGGLR